MAKVLSSIALNAPASPVVAAVSDTFAFSGTPTLSGSGGAQAYDFRWEVNPGSGYVPLDNSTTGLRTSATNPIVGTKSTSQQTCTVSCAVAGSYTIRMVGAPVSGGSYTVSSATQTVTVNAPIVVTPDPLAMTLAGAAPAVSLTANVFVSPDPLALALTGAVPAVTTPVAVTPDALALALSGATPEVSTPIAVNPDALALALAGAVPSVALPVAVTPDPLPMTLAGAMPDVAVTQGEAIVVTPAPMALALTGAAPAVGVSDNILITPGVLALNLGFATPAVAVTDNVVVVPGPLGLSFDLSAPSVFVESPITVGPDPLALSVGGATASVSTGSAGGGIGAYGWLEIAPNVLADMARSSGAARQETLALQARAVAMFARRREQQTRQRQWLLGLMSDEDYIAGENA